MKAQLFKSSTIVKIIEIWTLWQHLSGPFVTYEKLNWFNGKMIVFKVFIK